MNKHFVWMVMAVLAGCAVEDIDDDDAAGIEDLDDSVDDKADTVALSSAEARAIVALVNDADAIRLRDLGLSARAANNLANHRAAADRQLSTHDDDYFDDVREIDAVPYIGKTALVALTKYARSTGLVDLMAVVESGLAAGDIRNYLSLDEAVAILRSPHAEPNLTALRAFYVTTPAAWGAYDPWLGETPRRTPLLARDADQEMLTFFKSHGYSSSDLLLAKLGAQPSHELPTAKTTGMTHASFVTGINNRGAFPTAVVAPPSGVWTASYSKQGSRESLWFSTERGVDIEIAGTNIRSPSQGFASGDGSTLRVAADGWATNSARVYFQVKELVVASTGKVERAVVVWNRFEDLRFGVEPGYLFYNAADPAGTWSYESQINYPSVPAVFGPFFAVAGSQLTARSRGAIETDLTIKVGATSATIGCTAAPGFEQFCSIRAEAQPIWVEVKAKAIGTVGVDVTWTPAPR